MPRLPLEFLGRSQVVREPEPEPPPLVVSHPAHEFGVVVEGHGATSRPLHAVAGPW